jgi:DNA-binding NtrC family response regulator
MSEKFLKQLMEYNWPGNIRELQNALLRAVLLTNSELLTPDALPQEILSKKNRQQQEKGSFNDQVDAFKRQIIIETLDENSWVQKKAAEGLRLKPSTLYELIKRLGIQK